MELIGIILKPSYYKLAQHESCEINALPITTLGDTLLVRCQLSKNWSPGKSFMVANKNKVFLVWNNQEAKLRLIHDGAWITLQRIKLPSHRGR